jgi:hypothetical protein
MSRRIRTSAGVRAPAPDRLLSLGTDPARAAGRAAREQSFEPVVDETHDRLRNTTPTAQPGPGSERAEAACESTESARNLLDKTALRMRPADRGEYADLEATRSPNRISSRSSSLFAPSLRLRLVCKLAAHRMSSRSWFEYALPRDLMMDKPRLRSPACTK